MLTLKEHVSGKSKFSRYRAGNLYYVTDTNLEFPIPIDDCNEATFPAEERSIFFMRWIRKHLQSMTALDMLTEIAQKEKMGYESSKT